MKIYLVLNYKIIPSILISKLQNVINLVNFEITRKLIDLDKVKNLINFENVRKLMDFENARRLTNFENPV